MKKEQELGHVNAEIIWFGSVLLYVEQDADEHHHWKAILGLVLALEISSQQEITIVTSVIRI